MYKVLINAYSVSPGRGSEPGMGWNWVVNLARYCELHIITEGEWRDKIEAELPLLPHGDNMHFYYNEMPENGREMSRNQGDWRFYLHYAAWQRKTYRMALDIIESQKIDIIHQLNMIGYREPGYLWQIKDIPFVWGPTGGNVLFPTAFLKGVDTETRLKVRLKNIINSLQSKFHIRVHKAIKRADALLAATSQTEKWLKEYKKENLYCINETGCHVNDICKIYKPDKETFDIIWAGRFLFSKQLNLALDTIARLKDLKGLRLHILGSGDDKTVEDYKKQAGQLGINHLCVWHGLVSQKEVFSLMSDSDLFFFPSLIEGTPHVVLEALQHKLPVLCFDCCGQGDVVNDKVGRKVKMTTPEQSVEEFAGHIKDLYGDRNLLSKLSRNSMERQEELSWDSKAREVLGIYRKLLG